MQSAPFAALLTEQFAADLDLRDATRADEWSRRGLRHRAAERVLGVARREL